MLRLSVAVFCTAVFAHAAEAPREVAGSAGAMAIPFTMPFDGTATVGIYTKEGRLLRPLVQAVPLPKGAQVVRWDGMDLWGNLLPAGTEAVAKIFAGPGLRAKWEFPLASPNPIPWPTKPFGEGEAQRTGGWLGDHGFSSSAVAVGNRVWFGSIMAEHGHTVIMCNLDGEKMWGRGGLEGWKGPRLLASDGTAVFGVVEKNHLHRLELTGEKSAQIADTKDDEIVGLAAQAGRVVLTLKNHEAAGALLAGEVGAKDFDFKQCVPVPDSAKAYNRNLTGEEQFATTFSSGGHPQTGIAPGGSGASAGIAAKFKKPVTVGTLLVQRLEVPVDAQFFALKKGAPYAPPVPGSAPGADWLLIGRSDLARRVNTVTAAAEVTTDALYIRLTARDAAGPKKWPKLTMCRIVPRRLERVDQGAKVQLPAGTLPGAPVPGVLPGDTTWSFRSTEPMSDAAPQTVVVDLGRETAFDALVLLNLVNDNYAIDAQTGGKWTEVAVFKAGHRTVEGSLSASTHANDTRISLPQTVTTRALRFRLTDGLAAGRWAQPMNTTDALRSDVADIALLKLSAGRPKVPEMLLQVRDGATGALLSETKHASVNMTALAAAADGTFYSIAERKLCRTILPAAAGGAVQHTVLNDRDLKNPTCLGVSADGRRIAVGDFEAKAVFLFDAKGALTGKIGTGSGRQRGSWNPQTVDQPGAVAFDSAGKIWVTEKTYTPKRITRYSAEGKFEKEFLGPPHYGGGGWLDPSLKTFWYEAGEYEVDFARGTSRLKNLNDVQSDPASPAQEIGSYTYTKVGRPVHHDGHRYIVGDVGGQYSPAFVVCLLDEGQTTWKPAAVMGSAQDSSFLTREDRSWRAHWLKQNLASMSFIWCDLNGDAQYQIEEVQLFKNADVMAGAKGTPFGGAYWGSLCGPDLTFWGSSARLAPTRFTAAGVPVYEAAKIQPFDYTKIAPVYMGNMIANAAAKSGFGGASMVARDGSLAVEGQPYVVRPDLSIKGGPVPEKPGDYTPRPLGTVLDNPLSFIGSAATKSPVGEVAMLNGDNGQWFLWAVQEGVLLGEIFTGKEGSFGSVTTPARGMDVTGYKQDWETFFGNFVGGADGRYYVVAGRGHFGVSRVEGIDEITVATQPVRVTAESVALNEKLRPQLLASAAARKARSEKKEKRELKLPALEQRAKGFVLDGDLAEWGDTAKFQRISEDGALAFDAAISATALTVAYRGNTGTANHSQDWRYLFKTGFAFDLLVRPGEGREASAQAGDKRLVFGRHQGQWVAVLYDYVAPAAKPGEGVNYSSPVTATQVDRVVLLPETAARVRVKEAGKDWTAEVQIDWSALGLTPAKDAKFRADFGILTPDSGGLQVERRTNWSDPDTLHVADLAVEAQIHPANWGTMIFQP